MQGLSTLFADVGKMYDTLKEPEFLGGTYFFAEVKQDDLPMDTYLLLDYFGFDRAKEIIVAYFKLYPDADVILPQHRQITLFFAHLKKIGIYDSSVDFIILKHSPTTAKVYDQILKGTFPRDVDWNMEVPIHPYEDMQGYTS